MKKIVVIVLVALSAHLSNVYGQELQAFMNGDKYGYFDDDGRQVIDYIYDEAEDFEEGVGRVMLDGQYGAINKLGEVVIPLKYTFLGAFTNGVAVFNIGGEREWGDDVIGGKWGLIDTKNKVVIAAVYDALKRASDDLFIAKKGDNWGVLNGASKTIIPFNYSFIDTYGKDYLLVNTGGELSEMGTIWGGQWGTMDKTGKVVIDVKYEDLQEMSDGLICAYDGEGWGFIDQKGKVIVPFKYGDASFFENGYAIVSYEWQIGVIDKQGNEVIPIKYDNIQALAHGMVSFFSDGKWGYLDMKGNVVLPARYEEASPFYFVQDNKNNNNKSSLVAVVKKNDLYGVINAQGIELIKPKYNFISAMDSTDGKFEVELNEKYGMIDVFSGKEIIAPKYDGIVPSTYGLITVDLNSKNGLFDEAGKMIIPIGKYDSFNWTEDGQFITVNTKNKWGVIDLNGQVIVPLIYDDRVFFSEGLARVQLKEKYGFIDASGKEIVSPKYYSAMSFKNNFATVINNEEKAGIIDKTGKEVVPLIYDKAQALSPKVIIALQNAKVGVFNSNGQEIAPFIYDDRVDVKNDKANLTKDGKDYVLDLLSGEINEK